ncbi:MAG: hypothetical protein IKV45_00615 [Firmicutes bacterium]|nr:hypothetical protein [Bacillota bacterium]
MKYAIQKKITTACLLFVLFISVISAATLLQEKNTAKVPSYEKQDISSIADKNSWTEEDYAILWEQTGLGKTILQTVQNDNDRKEILLAEQKRFFGAPDHICTGLSLFSKAEIITDPADYYPLYDLQPGDVLLTKSTHTLCYRHGHSAIYIGDGMILEAAAIGLDTNTAEADLWGRYPSGIHLRFKGNNDVGAQAAEYAKAELAGDKYHLLAGAFGIGESTDHTQCAHLIWAAYRSCGVDISDRDFPITPKSILESGQFEILRCWGFDPKDLNW